MINMRGLLGKVWGVAKFLIFFLIANLVAAFIIGMITGLTSVSGSNIVFSGMNSVQFNPLITIAYLMLFYFLLMFHRPNQNSQYGLFLLTILLSFMMNFLQGSILLVVFFFLAQKTHLI
jgi:hypothetical protein